MTTTPTHGPRTAFPRPDDLDRSPDAPEVPMLGTSLGSLRATLTRTTRESLYLLASWPVLMAAFTVVISLLATSVGLAIIWFGIPLLIGTFGAARGFVLAECALQRSLLGEAPRPGSYLPRRDGEPLWKSALRLVVDPQSWIEVGFALFAWFVATITWSLTVIWWSAALAGLASPLLDVYFPNNYAGLGSLVSWQNSGVRVVLDLATGLVALVTLPWVIHALASLQSSLFGAVIGARGLREQVAHLETSRTAARDAEAAGLRKLERDLHDGPQQRLVRLQMDLGRALHQVDDDPAKARAAMESSLTQAQQTLDELRSLSRGIAPPILVDRGLVAALEELTTRSAIPATFTTNLPRDRRPERIPARVQDATFYLVSEALTNAAKHSGAARAEVEVHLGEGILRVTVRDDGRGGAAYGPSSSTPSTTGGTGLLGLRDRLAGLDGSLDVYSPAGGPTVITAILPCG